MDVKVEVFKNSPIESNCYLIYNKLGQAVLVDPATICHIDLYDFISANQIKIDYCLITHGHFDHILGLKEIEKKFNPIMVFSDKTLSYLENPKKNLSAFHGIQFSFSPKNYLIIQEDYYKIPWNNSYIEIIKTPGHTDSCITCKFGEILFVGDLIIQNEKIVTKLPTGNKVQAQESIDKIYSLAKIKILYSGHKDPIYLMN